MERIDVPSLEYQVRRTTTDKLQAACNAFGSEGWRVTAAFVGGRDWTIIAERPLHPIRDRRSDR